MNKEELQEFLNTDEGKEVFNAAFESKIKEEGYKSSDDVAGLVAKKNELLGKVTKHQKEKHLTETHKNILDKLSEHDITDIDELEELFSSKKLPQDQNPQGNDFEKQLKRLTKQMDLLKEENLKSKNLATEERNKRIQSQRDTILTTALNKVNVKGEALAILRDHFDKKIMIEETEKGEVNFLANDSEGLNPDINTYIDEWSKTDAAKDFLQKPANRGSGANLNNSNSRSMTRKEFQNLDPTSRMQNMKEGIVITD